MNNQTPEELPDEIRLETIPTVEPIDLGSIAIVEARSHVAADEAFVVEIVDLPADGPDMQIIDGVVQLDRAAHEAEVKDVTDWLTRGIVERDEQVLAVYLRNIHGDDEAAEALRMQLRQAFADGEATGLQLEELSVHILSAGIAERNMIRNGLRPELSHLPLYFTADKGETIDEEDLDIIIARSSKSDKFKVIIGSKQGISAIHAPQTLKPSQFVPNLEKIAKDEIRDTITIPLKAAANRSKPSINTIEIHLGPVDLANRLDEQDEQEAREARRHAEQQRREQEAADERRRQATYYSPPAPSPRPGRWSNYSG